MRQDYATAVAVRKQALLESRVRQLEADLVVSDPADRPAIHGRLRSLRKTLARTKGRHTRQEWEAIVAETGGICVRCGFPHDVAVEYPYKAYIVPIAFGGSDSIDNIQPLCRSCVSAKKDEQINWLAIWREHQGG